jgi:hypothetical protein
MNQFATGVLASSPALAGLLDRRRLGSVAPAPALVDGLVNAEAGLLAACGVETPQVT